ncbi:MAG: BAX inhibitor protein [Gammaproteobacteria bacterium RIFCSPHIGHO2_12_FULL_42_13]|nr:MAG: BAX inhibitor protein [Gammaproteobacteria bacterium RIFCSPHIGHO2_12_FULL_42_13]
MPFGTLNSLNSKRNIGGSALYQSTFAVNTVLRKTYFLLSLTLFFSAIMAFFSMTTAAAPLPALIQIVGMFGLLILTLVLRNSPWGLVSIFAFTGFTGYTLGPMLNMYISEFTNGSQLVLTSLGATAVVFLGLSGYVLASKKDFSYLGGFLFIVLLAGVMLSLTSMFFHLPMLQLGMSALFVVLFSAYILFDTSRILHGGESNYISATVSLYLDILNLFIALLQILSYFAGNRR